MSDAKLKWIRKREGGTILKKGDHEENFRSYCGRGNDGEIIVKKIKKRWKSEMGPRKRTEADSVGKRKT